jgi:NDP-sugar pyrophosphorylase family protein
LTEKKSNRLPFEVTAVTPNTDVREALVLAGGLGTRLRAVVDDRPKPLATVAERPFLDWLVLQARGEGIRRIVFCTGHLGEAIQGHFEGEPNWGVEFLFSREKVALGTGGAARLAIGRTSGTTILVLNGDSYCRFNLRPLYETHRRRGAIVSMVVVSLEDCSRYGSVDIAPDGLVQKFAEKDLAKGRGLINAGIYLVDREVIESLPQGVAISLERDVLSKLAGNGLYAVVSDGPFIDIGTPESLKLASNMLRKENFA